MKKILILSANPINTNRLRLDEEVREIKAALSRAISREEFELINTGSVRIDDLRQTLLDNNPEIVHFSGHGTGTDGLVLENTSGEAHIVGTESLSDLFELFKEQIECVLLNACYSEIQASAIHQHIDCVIGMVQPIQDRAAINFSKGFYDAIFSGRNYADAFRFGCNNIDLNNLPEKLIPVIKIRNPSKILFSPHLKEKKAFMSSERTINMGSGNYNEKIQGNYVQGNYYAGGEKQSLTEAAALIQKLLEQLDKTIPIDTTLGKMQVAAETIKAIENNPMRAARVTSALKAGGVQALAQLLNHPAASFVIGALEDWQKTKST